MKKIFLSIILLLSVFSVFSQSEIKQIVLPKRIYVGDTAQLHYTFRSGVDFFPNEEQLVEKKLIPEKFPFSVDNENFTILNAVLQRNGPLYTVVITFIPWKPGYLDFSAFDLYSLVFGNGNVAFELDPEAIEVASVLQNEDVSLRPFAAPLLFPGTIYFVYAALIVFLILVAVGIQFAIRWQEFSAKMKERQTVRRYVKSSKRALRQLKKLEKNSQKINDIAFCTAIQKIFREYLTVRFGINFFALSTNQFVSAFNKATGGVLEGFVVDNLEAIVEIFMRMDYIRFAGGSLESKRLPEKTYKACLQEGERAEKIETSRAIIRLFERGR